MPHSRPALAFDCRGRLRIGSSVAAGAAFRRAAGQVDTLATLTVGLDFEAADNTDATRIYDGPSTARAGGGYLYAALDLHFPAPPFADASLRHAVRRRHFSPTAGPTHGLSLSPAESISRRLAFDVIPILSASDWPPHAANEGQEVSFPAQQGHDD